MSDENTTPGDPNLGQAGQPIPPIEPVRPAQPVPPTDAFAPAAPAAPAAPLPLARPPRPRTPLSLIQRDWVTAVIAGAGGFVFAYIVAIVSALLAGVIAAAGATGSPSTGATTGTGTGTGGVGGLNPDAFSNALTGINDLLAIPTQLVVLANGGRLSLSAAGSSSELTIAGSASVGMIPVLILAAEIVAVVLITRLAGRVLPLRERMITAGITGVVLVALTVITGLVFSFRIPSTLGISISPITAVGVGSIIGALVIGAGAAFLARPALLARLHPIVNVAFGIVRVAAVHLGALVALVAIVIVVWALIAHPSGGAALPLLLGNAAVVATAIGMFGGFSLSQSTGQALTTLGSAGGASGASGLTGSLTAFSSPTAWVWLLVFIALVAAFVAGLALALRRGSSGRPKLDWVLTPGVYLLGGVVLFVLGTAVFDISVSALGGIGSIGLTPWTPLIFALWGGAIEVVARYVAPALLPRVAPGVLAVGRRIVGDDTALYRDPAFPAQPAVWAGTAGSPDARPLTPRARKILVRSLIIGGAVVVVVVAGSITVGVLRSTVWGPAATATAFMHDLSTGSATRAGTVADIPGLGSGALSDKVLAAAKDRPTAIAIGAATQSGDLASVQVSYLVGSSRESTTIQLRRVSTSWLVKDDWKVTTAPEGHILVQAPDALHGEAVDVDGVQAGTVTSDVTTLTTFPGTYSVSVAGTKYFAGSTSSTTVRGTGETGAVQVKLTPTAALQTDALALVNAKIASCAAVTTADVPDGCPWYGVYTDSPVTYTVTTPPKLKVQVDETGQIEVTSTSDGQLETKYTDNFFGESYPYDETDGFQVEMLLAVKGGTLVVTDSY